MSLALAPVTLRTCNVCAEERPRSEFPYGSHGCLECRRAYMRDRYAKMRRGEWAPLSPSERGKRCLASRTQDRKALPAGFYVVGSEAALKAAMTAFFLTEGFSRLCEMTAALQAQIAKEHRAQLAKEGWIA